MCCLYNLHVFIKGLSDELLKWTKLEDWSIVSYEGWEWMGCGHCCTKMVLYIGKDCVGSIPVYWHTHLLRQGHVEGPKVFSNCQDFTWAMGQKMNSYTWNNFPVKEYSSFCSSNGFKVKICWIITQLTSGIMSRHYTLTVFASSEIKATFWVKILIWEDLWSALIPWKKI